ncbi:MAG: hypothetical protein M3Z33_00160 [Actinomycetota bacterium]|nr:hypothetical protein [Actinomycetota bacterium]
MRSNPVWTSSEFSTSAPPSVASSALRRYSALVPTQIGLWRTSRAGMTHR